MSDDGTSALRQLEAEEQARIQLGMQQINRIFGGGLLGINPTWAYMPGQKYYSATGEEYRKNLADPAYIKWLYESGRVPGTVAPSRGSMGGTSAGGNRLNDRSRVTPTQGPAATPGTVDAWDDYMRALASGGSIFTGRKEQAGFNDQFFNNIQTDYDTSQRGELQSQLQEMQEQVKASLARRGLMQSSVDREMLNQDASVYPLGSLVRESVNQSDLLANRAKDFANQYRMKVQEEKTNAVNQLLQSGNPQAAAQTANAAAATLRTPPVVAPLGQAFSDWAGIYFANRLGRDIAKSQAISPPVSFGFAKTPVSKIEY